MTTRVRSHRIILAILPLTACAESSPVTLRLADSAQAAGQRFSGEWTQTVIIERQEGDLQLDRELRARFRIEQANAAGTDTVNITLAFDSVRAAMNTPHGRQVYDTREQRNTLYRLAYARTGGTPRRLETPAGAPPAMGGPPSIHPLIDAAFPALPVQPVKVGDHWEHEWTRIQVDGVSVTERRITTRYTLTGVEDQSGERVARIDITSSGGPEVNPADSTRPGTIEGKGTARLGVADGVLRSLILEETVTGAGLFPGGISTYRQTSRYQLVRQPNGEAH